MNDTDLHKLFKELSGARTPKLPAHQKMLRARLLKRHANQQTALRRLLSTFSFIKSNPGVYMNKRIFTVGASALAISLFAVGVMVLNGPQQSVSASQLIEGAAKRAQQMSPAELAAFNEKHQQDLNKRLDEAKTSGSLKVLTDNDLTDWGWGPKRYDDTLKSYVGYIDNNNHRIVIALGEGERPLFVVDITVEAEARRQAEERIKNPQPSDPKTPAMEVTPANE